jgi:hypothetical protein
MLREWSDSKSQIIVLLGAETQGILDWTDFGRTIASFVERTRRRRRLLHL